MTFFLRFSFTAVVMESRASSKSSGFSIDNLLSSNPTSSNTIPVQNPVNPAYAALFNRLHPSAFLHHHHHHQYPFPVTSSPESPSNSPPTTAKEEDLIEDLELDFNHHHHHANSTTVNNSKDNHDSGKIINTFYRS